MKERFIKVLHVTRKFGFIMAAVMLFPHVASLSAVMASDGTSETEEHEVSMGELEQEYSQLEQALVEETAQIEEFYEKVSNELSQYVVEVELNIYELQIPENTNIDLTEEEIETFRSNLDITNQMMKDGLILIDANGDYYTLGEDDLFNAQSLALTSYTLNKYISIRIPFKTIKVWSGIDVGLTQLGSFVIGGLLFGAGIASSWASTAVVQTKVNQFLANGTNYYTGSALDKILNYLTNIGVSNSILNNVFGAFNNSYINVGIVMDLLGLFATIFLVIKTILTVSGGPLALFVSSVFVIAGSQMIGAGISAMAGGILRGRSVVKFRLPLSISAY